MIQSSKTNFSSNDRAADDSKMKICLKFSWTVLDWSIEKIDYWSLVRSVGFDRRLSGDRWISMDDAVRWSWARSAMWIVDEDGGNELSEIILELANGWTTDRISWILLLQFDRRSSATDTTKQKSFCLFYRSFFHLEQIHKRWIQLNGGKKRTNFCVLFSIWNSHVQPDRFVRLCSLLKRKFDVFFQELKEENFVDETIDDSNGTVAFQFQFHFEFICWHSIDGLSNVRQSTMKFLHQNIGWHIGQLIIWCKISMFSSEVFFSLNDFYIRSDGFLTDVRKCSMNVVLSRLSENKICVMQRNNFCFFHYCHRLCEELMMMMKSV